MWRYTADLLYILQNPAVREAFFPTTEHLFSVEAAKPEDRPAIARDHRAIRAGRLDRRARQLVAAGTRAFRVARDRPGAIAGFTMYCEMDSVSHRLVQEDPVLASAGSTCAATRSPRGQRILFAGS